MTRDNFHVTIHGGGGWAGDGLGPKEHPVSDQPPSRRTSFSGSFWKILGVFFQKFWRILMSTFPYHSVGDKEVAPPTGSPGLPGVCSVPLRLCLVSSAGPGCLAGGPAGRQPQSVPCGVCPPSWTCPSLQPSAPAAVAVSIGEWQTFPFFRR